MNFRGLEDALTGCSIKALNIHAQGSGWVAHARLSDTGFNIGETHPTIEAAVESTLAKFGHSDDPLNSL